VTSANGARVLIVDDDASSRRLLAVRLRALHCEVAMAADGQEALHAIQQEPPALILLDLRMPQMGGMELLRRLRRDGIDVPVIVVTAHGSIESAVEAMKDGAYDFLPKPFDPMHLEIVVRKALERATLTQEIEILAEEADRRHRLIPGKSGVMAAAVETARKAAASRATVLLLGESGTGKEIFARAIHKWSERRRQPFIAINCAALSQELLESELFGHEKGAFTGAHRLKLGKLELAKGGSVFLDEVGDVSAELQTKLLRFLEERDFERVGGTRPIRVDVRIIAATNRNLDELIRARGFREDLYHRLNVISVTLPPLRERREDIPGLAGQFLQRFSQEAKKTFTGIPNDALVRLLAYSWPGNVRELANVVERAVVLGSGPEIIPEDLPSRILLGAATTKPDGLAYREAVNVFRRDLVRRAIAQSGGNHAAAARALGLHEKYLSRLIRSLRIAE
jgi:DNA-binding NtrC family response regulator